MQVCLFFGELQTPSSNPRREKIWFLETAAVPNTSWSPMCLLNEWMAGGGTNGGSMLRSAKKAVAQSLCAWLHQFKTNQAVFISSSYEPERCLGIQVEWSHLSSPQDKTVMKKYSRDGLGNQSSEKPGTPGYHIKSAAPVSPQVISTFIWVLDLPPWET